jgi:spermidine synthase
MLPLLYFAFVLSGAAGLIYESIWARYLGLFVGHSAYAQVIVLVIFLGGMSLGALFVGQRTERIERPLLAYAVVELAIGIIGRVFHPLYLVVTDFAYSTVFPSLGAGPAQITVKWLLAGMLILPQSILLGMTFPLMSAGVVRQTADRAGRALSMLYFANSIGAAGGVLLSGFYLVALAGLPGTLLAAVLTNLAVAVIVFLAVRARGEPGRAVVRNVDPERTISGVGAEKLWRLLLAVSFGTALSSFVYEIGWMRMLAFVLGSATHSFELMLSAFILGLALGAWWIRGRADEGAQSLRMLAFAQLAMGALAIATMPLYLASFHWMIGLLAAVARSDEGYRVFTVARYVMCLAVMLPATFCAGTTLPLITRTLLGIGVGERAIGQVYGVNTLGSIVGAALAGLVLLPWLGLKWLLVLGGAVDVALGMLLLWVHWRRSGAGLPSRTTLQLTAAGAAAVLVTIIVAARFDPLLLASGVYRYGYVVTARQANVVYNKDGRTATVTVRRSIDGSMSLITNGKPDASLGANVLNPSKTMVSGPLTHDTPTQQFVALVALAHKPNARTAAVIGHGSGMTSHVLLGDPTLASLVTIEIEPKMIEGSRRFYPANRRVFDDPRSTFAIDDARSYFAAHRQKFDLVLSEPSNPWVSGVSGLFTTEFYGRMRQFLTDDGIFAQWLQLYEIDDSLVLSVIAAISENFPAYSIYQLSAGDILIVATNRRALPAPDWSVLQYPGIAADLAHTWTITPRTMATLRLAGRRALDPLVQIASEPNSDFFPLLDLNAERTRFLKTGASALEALGASRVNLTAIADGVRNGLGDPYAVVPGIPRLQASALAAAMRTGDGRGGPDVYDAMVRKQWLDDELAGSRPPRDWHVWVRIVNGIESTLHGGMAGVADSAFYGSLRSYLRRVNAPPLAQASVDFLHGMAAWDFAEAARAADPLVDAAKQGDLWLDGDQLRDGAVMAKLETGDRKGARDVFRALIRNSARPVTDLRTRLLYAYITDTTATSIVRSAAR